MDAEAQRQLAAFQRTLVQMNLRLTKLGEVLEGGSPRPAASSGGAQVPVDGLFDLLDAVDRTVRQPSPALPVPPWLARWLGWTAPAPFDLTGLALARDHAVRQLARIGIAPIRAEGSIDAALHQVIEVRPTDDPAQHLTIAATHRSGWAVDGEPPQVLRFAQVTAWRHGVTA